jgi:hypothetical protein
MNTILLSLLITPLSSILPHTLAYIDPGTGSIILQAVAAAVAGVAIAAKLYWHQLLKFFGLRHDIKSESSEMTPPENRDA